MREHILHNYHELSVFLANISIVFVFSTLYVLFGGYIFIKTPSSKRHKTSFILGIAVLWCSLLFNLISIRWDFIKILKIDTGMPDVYEFTIPLCLSHYLALALGEFALVRYLYLLRRREKSKKSVVLMAILTAMRAISHAIVVALVIKGDLEGNKPKYYEEIKIAGTIGGIGLAMNNVLLSGLFLSFYLSKLRYAIMHRKFLQVLGRITTQHAILPSFFIIPSAALYIQTCSSKVPNPHVALRFTIIHQIFLFSFSISVAYAMYLLNLGPRHYQLYSLRSMPELKANEIVQAFSREKRLEAIVEHYLREVYFRVGGISGYICHNVQDKFVPCCSFELHGSTEKITVSFDNIRPDSLPVSVLQVALLKNETIVEGCDYLKSEPHKVSEFDEIAHGYRRRSIICVPTLSERLGRAFVCIVSTKDAFVDMISPMEIYILELLSQQMIVSLENCRLFNELADMNRDLDKKVADRTRELEKQKLELEEAKQRAEESARAKSVFLANMSHEVRTPASQIISAAGMLMDTTLNTEQNDYINIINSSGNLLLNLLNDILDLSKMDSQKLKLECAPFNLRQVIKTTVEAFSVSKPLYLAYVVDPDLPDIIIGDALRLQQIFLNLISNALKFTSSGYVLLEAKMLSIQDGTDSGEFEIMFSVSDTGNGISKEKLEVIFQRFEQENTSISRLHGGTGLGLAISKDLCSLMNSKLCAVSEVGRGSKFYFTLQTRSPQNSSSEMRNNLPCQKRVLLLSNPSENELDQIQISKSILQFQIESAGGQVTHRDFSKVDPFIQDIDHFAFDCIVVDTLNLSPKQLETFVSNLPHPKLDVIFICHNERIERLQYTNRIFDRCTFLTLPYKQSSLSKAILKNDKNFGIKEDTLSTDNMRTPTLNGSLNILLAEDNTVNQRVMKAMFKRLGYNIDVAVNGLEATRMASKKDYDCIFMDVRMPIVDGLEATKRIRQHSTEISPNSKIPIIIGLSADALQENYAEGLNVGMDAYLSKPISRSTLSGILQRYFG